MYSSIASHDGAQGPVVVSPGNVASAARSNSNIQAFCGVGASQTLAGNKRKLSHQSYGKVILRKKLLIENGKLSACIVINFVLQNEPVAL